MFSQNLASVRDQSKTGEGSPEDDDSYLGYSVTTGEFDGDRDSSDTAVGMPRGAGLTGKVDTHVEQSEELQHHVILLCAYFRRCSSTTPT